MDEDEEEERYGDEEGYGDYEMLEGAEGAEAEAEGDDGELTNLAELFKGAQEEKTSSLETNQALQRKLADYLRTVKKSDEQKDAEKSVTDQDARYFKCLAQVNELRDELRRLEGQYDKTAMDMKK